MSFLKAMIILAWNGSGELSSVFTGDIFKKVLSVFITAAILKLGQGMSVVMLFTVCNIAKLSMFIYYIFFDQQLGFVYLK